MTNGIIFYMNCRMMNVIQHNSMARFFSAFSGIFSSSSFPASDQFGLSVPFSHLPICLLFGQEVHAPI
jgi:hypothetical protein